MLRQILCNHAYVTGHSHQQALANNRVAQPLELLLASTGCLQRSLTRRLHATCEDDIIHCLGWGLLGSIRAQIIKIINERRKRNTD